MICRCGTSSLVVVLALVSISASANAQGFGNVHINFSTPTGYLLGFRDYLNSVSAATNGSNVGPIAYVGNYGTSSDGGDIPFFRIADDVNNNGVAGSIVIVDPVTGQISILTDFDDLHTFNIGFDRISAGGVPYSGAIDVINVVWLGDDQGDEEVDHSLSSWQAAEALRISDWQITGNDAGVRPAESNTTEDDPNPSPALTRKFNGSRLNGVGMLYGMRMFERWDSLSISADGGILGPTQTSTVANNHIMGPAIGLIWIKTHGRWTARLQGLASIGFNSGSVEQSNSIGFELVPGAVNRLLYARPIESAHHDSFDEFSPSGELRAEANYRITENITFAINWSGVAVENALESTGRMRYYLPDFGLIDPGNQRLLVHNFFCGIEMVR